MKRKIELFKNLEMCIDHYQQHLNMYLILDAAQVSNQTLTFIQECRGDERIEFYSLFAGTTEGNAPFEVSPMLIVLNDVSIIRDEKLNFLHQIWRDEEVLNLVTSKLSLEKFTKKMKQYLTVKFPDNTQKLFRWYDPRVLKKINKILDENQEYEFFDGIEKWIISVRNYQDVNSNKIMILENT